MAADYIPERDERARWWMMGFSTRLSVDPAAYGVAPERAAQLLALATAYRDAMQIVSAPETRTISAIRNKTEARKAAERVCRQVARQIKANPDLSAGDLERLGLRPNRQRRRYVPVPDAKPTLLVKCDSSGNHVLWCMESNSHRRRAKPAGATAIQLFYYLDDGPVDPTRKSPAPHGEQDLRLYGTFTSNPIRATHPLGNGGRQVTYYARWVSRRGEAGHLSDAVTTRIAA